MKLGRRSGILRRGRFLVLGIGRFGLVIGWGTWGDFKAALKLTPASKTDPDDLWEWE